MKKRKGGRERDDEREEERMEGHVLFNDALNTFYVWLYGVRHNGKGPLR